MRIKSFRAWRPSADLAEQVASVPYDTVNTAEAAELADGRPWSFLRIVRPELELPEGTDVYSDAVYERAANNFRKFQDERVLIQEEEPSIYVYRQIMGDHSQTGVVACSHVEDYENDLIKKHEKTRPAKEDDRTRHVKTLNANAGPVFLTYRADAAIDAIVSKIENGDPLYDITAPDGVRHTVWLADGSELEEAFKSVGEFYIADGHHRAAAAARAGRELRDNNPDHDGKEEYNWFLTVLFPSDQLNILAYNRCVRDLNGLEKDAYLTALRDTFTVVEGAEPVPSRPESAAMYLDGKWYGLTWELSGTESPVDELDAAYLQENLLEPVLGIENPRTDERIDFIGGIRGVAELERLVDSGEWAVAFSMYPCGVEQMMAIADAGEIMPPKSTWFEPKLRSGLLVHTLD
ncbi:hypothetical protein BVX97_02905 [bacterium E08(2017)]|nr:hypothetical protein BVX97_02905 [bacterium E08(2017)]